MREAFNEFVNDHPDGKIKRKDFGKMMKKVGKRERKVGGQHKGHGQGKLNICMFTVH